MQNYFFFSRKRSESKRNAVTVSSCVALYNGQSDLSPFKTRYKLRKRKTSQTSEYPTSGSVSRRKSGPRAGRAYCWAARSLSSPMSRCSGSVAATDAGTDGGPLPRLISRPKLGNRRSTSSASLSSSSSSAAF